MSEKKKSSFFWNGFVLWFSLFFWGLRVFKLFKIIATGILPDFAGYHQAVVSLLSQNPNFELILSKSFGPPFILIPFLPFAWLPLLEAEIITTAINLVAYWLTFYWLWKRFLKRITPLFWLLMALMSLSFPLTYSLGAGNPIGLVTLGIYGFWILKNKMAKGFFLAIAGLSKIYPVMIIPSLFFSKTKRKEGYIAIVSLLVGFGLSMIILPKEIWQRYLSLLKKVVSTTGGTTDLAIYNQSLASSLSRLGLEISYFSVESILMMVFLVSILLAYLILAPKKSAAQQLEAAVALLCFTFLVHPFPWQYYFASLLPFLLIKVGQRKLVFLLPLILISFDGNRYRGEGMFKNFLDSAQFFSTLFIYSLITFRPIAVHFRQEM